VSPPARAVGAVTAITGHSGDGKRVNISQTGEYFTNGRILFLKRANIAKPCEEFTDRVNISQNGYGVWYWLPSWAGAS
jgi:hypothetical protein